MGKIVGGFATSHVLFPPDGVEGQAERVIEGMLAIREQIQGLRPDLIVLAASDHLNNFNLATQVTLAIAVADHFTTLGDGGLEASNFVGNRGFAEGFARYGADHDFDLVQVEEVQPDHGMAIPRLIADPEGRVPIVPLFINSNMPVPASPSRCFRLGRTLNDFVETQRPSSERVVVLGAGGMSHWLRLPEQGQIAIQFDRDFMDRITQGRAHELAAMSTADMFQACGNGGLELTAWLFMAGALPGAHGECLYYEPITPWISGMGGLSLRPADL